MALPVPSVRELEDAAGAEGGYTQILAGPGVQAGLLHNHETLHAVHVAGGHIVERLNHAMQNMPAPKLMPAAGWGDSFLSKILAQCIAISWCDHNEIIPNA